MSTKIKNGGIELGFLELAKESGIKLSEDEEERLKLLNSLPKNEWIDLDKNGNPIGNEIAENQQKEKLKKFKIQ